MARKSYTPIGGNDAYFSGEETIYDPILALAGWEVGQGVGEKFGSHSNGRTRVTLRMELGNPKKVWIAAEQVEDVLAGALNGTAIAGDEIQSAYISRAIAYR